MTDCPACGHPNHDTAKFCEECAEPLAAPPPTTPTPAAARLPLVRCPSCGHPNETSARFCEECATGLVAPTAGTRPARSGALVLAWVAVALAVVVLVLAGVAWFLTNDDGGPDPATTTTTAPAPVAPPASTPTTARPAVADLPSGLFCRDLNARGYSYAEAVEYWNLEGQPDRMVARDLPCQTVYPEDTVFAYWGLDEAGTPPGD